MGFCFRSLPAVVSTCLFAGMINTEKKYCAEVCMVSFSGSVASLIPWLSPPHPVFEERAKKLHNVPQTSEDGYDQVSFWFKLFDVVFSLQLVQIIKTTV